MLTALETRLFYTHRGAEKLCEGQSPDRALEIIERICGACSFAQALAYCDALEAIAGVVPPFQAQIWRAIFLELETLRARIGDTGALAAAADRPHIERRCAALRERLLGLNRAFTGMRHPRGVITPGGLRRDLPSEASGLIVRTLADIHVSWQKTTERLSEDRPLRRRLRGLGVLPRQTVEALGVVGPAAQASGMVRDCRLEQPHGAYAAFPPAPSTRVEGDAEARMLVRLEDTSNSFRLLAALLESLPGGAVVKPLGSLPAWAHGLGRAESARGENVCWLAIGDGGLIERCHLRAASYCTWPAVPRAAASTSLEDLPLLIASFGLCVACVDR
jgi:Ni,Fe-hydrogenase III large subunit